MNREEAKEYFRINYESPDGDYALDAEDTEYVIDKVYDDFESRTCVNCKYLNITLISDFMLCDKKVSSTHGTWKSEINKDFGCNKFKRKNNIK